VRTRRCTASSNTRWADTLNTYTDAKIKLKSGQDPRASARRSPNGSGALRERSGPIVRSESAQKERIDALRKGCQKHSRSNSPCCPSPEGQWDPTYELQTITLSVTPMKRTETRLNPAGRPADGLRDDYPRFRRASSSMPLADAGYFDDATTTCNETYRSSLHGFR